MPAIPTAQERQEARLERLIAHEKTQINHLSLAAPDEDAAWRATRGAAIARCRVRLAGYIGELEEAVRREKETSATSTAKWDTGEPPAEAANAAWRAFLRQADARQRGQVAPMPTAAGLPAHRAAAQGAYDWTQNPWDRNRARLQAGLVLTRVALRLAGVTGLVLVLAWAFRG
jgi:hypothetical protein